MPDRPAPPPAVQRLRVRYAKRGRLRFASHRDFQRALERALRRASIPVAYSAGFTPHPKVSYVGAAPTGCASEAEYFELQLSERRDPADVCQRLDRALPPGLDVVEAVEARSGSLAERMQASDWEIRLLGVEERVLRAAVDALVAAASVPVERVLKEGRRVVDARAAIVSAFVESDGNCAILRLVVRQVTPAVRPDDVLTGLRQVANLAPPVPAVVTRLAQGPLDEGASPTGRVADPLAPDRGFAADVAPGANGSAAVAAQAP
jgi:radical SAM-linked protein